MRSMVDDMHNFFTVDILILEILARRMQKFIYCRNTLFLEKIQFVFLNSLTDFSAVNKNLNLMKAS